MASVSLSQAYLRYVDCFQSESGCTSPVLGFSQWLGLSASGFSGDSSMACRIGDILCILQGVVPSGGEFSSAGGRKLTLYDDVVRIEGSEECRVSKNDSFEQVAGGESAADVVGKVVAETCEVVPVIRGKHYKRNKAKAVKRKQMGVAAQTSTEVAGRHNPESEGAFASCDSATRLELQQSRAKMFIAENKVKTAKAESQLRHMQMVKESRVNESKFELDRQTVEEKLAKISKARLGSGYVEGTIYSSAATPSLSSGSVSPNSSISMAEVKRKDDLIVSLESKLAKLTVDFGKVSTDLDEMKKEKVEAGKKERNAAAFRAQVEDHDNAARFRELGRRNASGYSQWY